MNFQPDEKGFYGQFGGTYIPEMLKSNIDELNNEYLKIIESDQFKKDFRELLNDYAGRPSALYYARNLSARYKARIFLKREDLNHTGSHKINNTLGQILIAERLGKKQIIAETGAGQHGVATATVCAARGLECIIFMGVADVERQAANVAKMRMLGAEVVEVKSGNQTLKDATNEAFRYWIQHPENSYFLIGSVVGPHPYPELVARLQSVISEELVSQLQEKTGRNTPDMIIACVGGGSNAAGVFYHFIDCPQVKLFAAEAAGKGVDTDETAASIACGKIGIIHGSKTFLMQNHDGQIIEPYSISAGLDYPGIGPLHAHLHHNNRVTYMNATDTEALDAAFLLTRTEGIIPALESAHALALLNKITMNPDDVVVVNISGRGDKDAETYSRYFNRPNYADKFKDNNH